MTKKLDPIPIACGNGVASIAVDVLRSGELIRVNNTASMKIRYNPGVDGHREVIVNNTLSAPIYIGSGEKNIGVLQISNKHKGTKFSERDEILLIILAQLLGKLFHTSMIFRRMSNRLELTSSLLNAPTALYSILPQSHSKMEKPIRLVDILNAMENASRSALKCSKCRAYIMGSLINESSSELISLDLELNNYVGVEVVSDTAAIRRTPMESGIAGHVVTAKYIYVMEDAACDPQFNAAVDIDPLESGLVAAPVLDLNGNVMACLEFVPSIFSPQLHVDKYVNDGRIPLDQASEWLAYQLGPPLFHIISIFQNPGKYYNGRPPSTPNRMRGKLPKQSIVDIPHIEDAFLDTDMNATRATNPFAKFNHTSDIDTSAVGLYGVDDLDSDQIDETKSSLNLAFRNLHATKENETVLNNKLALFEMEGAKLYASTSELEQKVKELERIIANHESEIFAKNESNRSLENQLLEINSIKTQNEILQRNVEGMKVELAAAQELKKNEKVVEEIVKLETQNDFDSEDTSKLRTEEEFRALETSLKQKEIEIEGLRASLYSTHADFVKKEALWVESGASATKLRDEKDKMELIINRLEHEVEILNKNMVEKDDSIKILQEAVTSMAAQNMADAEEQANSVTYPNISDDSREHVWAKQVDENGDIYFFNSLTQESTWDPPAGYIISVDGLLRKVRGST